MKWWNDFVLKIMLKINLPKTRIEVREGKYRTQYKEREIFSCWYYGHCDWTEDLQEAKNRIDESLANRKQKLIEKYNTPKVRYIKYP